MSNPPKITREERIDALAKAAEVRAKRAEVKRAVKAGEVPPVAALQMPVMQRCLVSDFLASLPGIGEVKTAALMGFFDISPRKRVGGLGRNQRAGIIDYLNEEFAGEH